MHKEKTLMPSGSAMAVEGDEGADVARMVES